jgi:hypothetical protein
LVTRRVDHRYLISPHLVRRVVSPGIAKVDA